MNILELNKKHLEIEQTDADNSWDFADAHEKLSIQFAIEMLEDIDLGDPNNMGVEILYKIKELKKYL